MAKVAKMTLEKAEAELSKAVYAATDLLERLEAEGFIVGNGHHARQKLAAAAVAELRARWRDPRKKRCGIRANGGMIGYAACDLEWGHDGEQHSNGGDGFYAMGEAAEHRRRQLIRKKKEKKEASS